MTYSSEKMRDYMREYRRKKQVMPSRDERTTIYRWYRQLKAGTLTDENFLQNLRELIAE